MEKKNKEIKSPSDMISDGVLSYGVDVGRFVFEEEGYTVYVISDFQHIGPSDVMMVYQITKEDYQKLLTMSCKNQIPSPSIPSAVTDACKKEFLCGQSAYCKRYDCTIDDVDLSLAERLSVSKASVMNYCPNCGKKNAGENYCLKCGTRLLKEDQQNIRIRMTRDSVSLGDDCMAPHDEEVLFKSTDTLKDLLDRVAEYVPAMYDYEWEVMCGAEVLGKLISGSDKKYQVKLEQENIGITQLQEHEIFCRHRFVFVLTKT